MIYNHLRIKALFVRAKGIEPIRLSAPDPKSGLSTNFNTPACLSEERIANLVLFILIAKLISPYIAFSNTTLNIAEQGFTRLYTAQRLKTYSKSYTEAHGYIGINCIHPVPEFKTMMIMRLCWRAQGITSTNPEISKETTVHILIANSAEQGTHIRKSTVSAAMIVKIMRIHYFRAKIKTLEAYLIIVRQKEFMTIPYSESKGIIIIFIISGTDEATAQLAALPQFRKSPFV